MVKSDWRKKQLHPRVRVPIYQDIHEDLSKIKGNKTWDAFLCDAFGLKRMRK